MGNKKGRSVGIKPWYSQYNQLQLRDLITGVIPKRIRNIQAGQARLHSGRPVAVANFERHHIVKNLSDIDDALAKIEKALIDGEDIKRWKEFPGLAAAVEQVNRITNSLDVQTKQTPAGPFKFNASRFFDQRTPGNQTVNRPNHAATGANMEPLRKQIKNKIKVQEEGDIEEGEIIIKDEDKDEPGVPLNVGSPERPPPPEPVNVNRDSQAEPHQFGHPYTTGFGNYPPGPPAHWMPQPPFSQPFYPPNYWDGVPNHYWHTPHPAVYRHAVMPHYNSGFVGFAPPGMTGQAHSQFPYGANYQYPAFYAGPQHFATPLPALPGTSPVGAFVPAPSLPPPIVAPESPIQPSKPSPIPSIEEAPPSTPVVARQLQDEQTSKRKLFDSPASSSGTGRPLKRRLTAQGGSVFDVDDNRYNHTKFPRSASGPPDFGTSFQEQVADSKKKLSQLERAFKPTGNTSDAA